MLAGGMIPLPRVAFIVPQLEQIRSSNGSRPLAAVTSTAVQHAPRIKKLTPLGGQQLSSVRTCKTFK